MATDSGKDTNAQGMKNDESVVAGITAPHVTRPDAQFSTQPLVPATGAPAPQMVKVKEVATGRVFAAWPVDARELVTHPNRDHVYAGEHDEMTKQPTDTGGNPTPVAPLDATSPTTVDPVAPTTPPRAASTGPLEDKSKPELQELARKFNVDPNQSRDKLVEQLKPHVAAGTIAATAPTPLAPPAPTPR